MIGSLIFSCETLSIRIAFRNNRFGAAASTRGTRFPATVGKSCEDEGGREGEARAGKLISLYRRCSQHEPYTQTG